MSGTLAVSSKKASGIKDDRSHAVTVFVWRCQPSPSNYESEGRTFESFRARHFLLVVFSALRAARLADPWFRRRAVSRL